MRDIDYVFTMVDVEGAGKITAKQFITGVLQLQTSEASRQMTQLQFKVQKAMRRAVEDAKSARAAPEARGTGW